jgi:hypothetical protein
MKSIAIILSSLVFFCTATMIVGCVQEPCSGIVCANSGTCVNGGCDCQVGYEGVHCETAMRDKFLGQWQINEDGTLSSFDQYVSPVKEDPNLKINEIYLYNLQNKFLSPVKATIQKDSITIPKQIIAGNTIEGYGHITGTNSLDQHYYQKATMTIWYYVIDPIGLRNEYGFPQDGKDGTPSIWTK